MSIPFAPENSDKTVYFCFFAIITQYVKCYLYTSFYQAKQNKCYLLAVELLSSFIYA